MCVFYVLQFQVSATKCIKKKDFFVMIKVYCFFIYKNIIYVSYFHRDMPTYSESFFKEINTFSLCLIYYPFS